MHKAASIDNQTMDERESLHFARVASLCGIFMYLPWAYVYPLVVGPATVDPIWERLVLVAFSMLGLLLAFIPQAKIWAVPYTYGLIFAFSGHLFSLVFRNSMHVAYQMGYLCLLTIVCFFLFSYRVFVLYALFNLLLLAVTSIASFTWHSIMFMGMINTIILINWLAIRSRLRTFNALRFKQIQLMESSEKIREKTRKIRSIMEYIQQGILTIDGPDGHLGPESSDYLCQLFPGRDATSFTRIHEILLCFNLPSDQREQVASAIACIVGEDSIAFDLNESMLIRSMNEDTKDNIRYFELDWNPIYDEAQNRVVSLLLCIRNVSELHELRDVAQRDRHEMKLFMELSRIPVNRLHQVLTSSWDLLKEAQKNLQSHDWVAVARLIHTLKGIARTFGLQILADASHEAETFLLDPAKVQYSLAPLDEILTSYQDIAIENFAIQRKEKPQIELDREQTELLATFMESLDLNSLNSEQQLAWRDVQLMLGSKKYISLREVLTPHLDDFSQLSLALGKEVPIVSVSHPHRSLDLDFATTLAHTLMHLLQNSLDHGLEAAHERLQAGKSAAGHIYMDLKLGVKTFEIHFSDDGRGLNLPWIQQLAQGKGLLQTKTDQPAELIANALFAPGFSTRETVTNISGRGVGLDAARHLLEKFGASIRIVLDGPGLMERMPFHFVLTIPNCFLAPAVSPENNDERMPWTEAAR